MRETAINIYSRMDKTGGSEWLCRNENVQ